MGPGSCHPARPRVKGEQGGDQWLRGPGVTLGGNEFLQLAR